MLDSTPRFRLTRVLADQGHSVRAIAGAIGEPKSTVGDTIAQLSDVGQLNRPDKSHGLATTSMLDGDDRRVLGGELLDLDQAEALAWVELGWAEATC